VIGRYLGGAGFASHSNRVQAVIDNLVSVGFIDKSPIGVFTLHDCDYWQDSHTCEAIIESDTTEWRQNCRQNGDKTVGPVVDSVIVKPDLDVPIVVEVKNENTTYSPAPQKRKRSAHKAPIQDERYQGLKLYMESEWFTWRHSNLGSCTQQVDWVRFARMLHRTHNDSVFSLQALQGAFLRWLTSSKGFERSQSIGWWCDNVHRYIGQTNISLVPAKVSREFTDDELTWWKSV
jgi:hypothetical protein